MVVAFTPPVPNTELLYDVYRADGTWLEGWGSFGTVTLPIDDLPAGTYFFQVLIVLPQNGPLTSYALTYKPATSQLAADDWESPVVRLAAPR
jgi:hypothetical protein